MTQHTELPPAPRVHLSKRRERGAVVFARLQLLYVQTVHLVQPPRLGGVLAVAVAQLAKESAAP
jgi:hypothetical protein